MGLRDHIDFHNQEVIRIVDFARLWSQESGHGLAEIFEFLRVVLSKRTYWHGYVRNVDGSLYAHDYKTDKAGRKTSPIFEPILLLHWLEQARDHIQKKEAFLAYDYCLRRGDYIKLLTAEHLPIPTFLLHPSVRPIQPPETRRQTIVAAERKCQQWLAELMRQGPQKKAKSAYKDDALQKFSGLSDRGFNRAWSSAIIDANAAKHWGTPGRKS